MDDYKELIERLRYERDDGAREEAADAIESLLAENERLKAELAKYRDAPVVAWADDKAANGQIGNCASDSAKRYWEKSNWSDRASAEKLKHALIVKPGE